MTQIKKTRIKGPLTQEQKDRFNESMAEIKEEYDRTGKVEPKPFDLAGWQSRYQLRQIES